ncbi:hypothetical protein B1748_31375 [Paenibacillus sp. MY03]|uniref:hypothetical protein n=1 Tax=Paenibacillus sp. MY03 TaxID=302980 RepID=UPI000B3CA8CE|nr:hypothetical protein [Paenibacillus sp. MY03]OUS69484.1 hypothetical protein B1748_31375 [Paenibacillus sp. MY03]
MSERIISQANLSHIENSLSTVAHNVSVVSDQVASVSHRVDETQSDLDQLRADFNEFVQQDKLSKNLQLAETRLVKVRQELENKFGHYEEVRRRAVGILQAVDVRLVKKETIENASEEQLLAAPNYWLAPCLIALSAWINDNQQLAERAMLEALRRDDEKTSLFFALVSRRASRYKASRDWLERYLAQQDPNQLQREIVVLIDGFTNGVFGPEARTQCAKQIEGWISELSQRIGFVETQREQWKSALLAKTESIDNNQYIYLQQFSPTWSQLKHSLEGAKLHTIIYDYFTEIFAKQITPSKNLAYAVDALLDNLVGNFDDEELPLRRDERLYTLIVKADGNKAEAEAKFNSEKLLEDQVSFTQLLTNFSMYPRESNASLATQKLSLALSKEWIAHAHDDITLDNRSHIPQSIEIKVDSWVGFTTDGSNELELIDDLTKHMNERKEAALKKNKVSIWGWGSLVAGIAFAVMGIGMPFLFVFAAAAILYFFTARHKVGKKKTAIVDAFEGLLSSSTDVLRAVLSDVVDFRREYEEEDTKADKIREFLDTVTPEQYAFSSYDSARAVIQSS